MIEGLSHVTFIVENLDRMEEVLTTVLGARKIYDSGSDTFSLSKERFFNVAGLWIVAMEGEPVPDQTYNHVAFKIPDSEYHEYLVRVNSLGLKVREGRPRVEGEGRSIYFYDHDNHLIELHSGTLKERLNRYTQ